MSWESSVATNYCSGLCASGVGAKRLGHCPIPCLSNADVLHWNTTRSLNFIMGSLAGSSKMRSTQMSQRRPTWMCMCYLVLLRTLVATPLQPIHTRRVCIRIGAMCSADVFGVALAPRLLRDIGRAAQAEHCWHNPGRYVTQCTGLRGTQIIAGTAMMLRWQALQASMLLYVKIQ